MGHFKVSVRVWHNGKPFYAKTTTYSETYFAAEHPEVLFQRVIHQIGVQLRRKYRKADIPF